MKALHSPGAVAELGTDHFDAQGHLVVDDTTKLLV